MSKVKKEAFATKQQAAAAAVTARPLGSPFDNTPIPKSQKKSAGRKQSRGK